MDMQVHVLFIVRMTPYLALRSYSTMQTTEGHQKRSAQTQLFTNLVALIAHDMRTPVAAIASGIAIFKARPSSPYVLRERDREIALASALWLGMSESNAMVRSWSTQTKEQQQQ